MHNRSIGFWTSARVRGALGACAVACLCLASCSGSDAAVADSEQTTQRDNEADIGDLLSDDASIAFDDGPLQATFGGYLLIEGESQRMCASLLESYPPQCGEELIELVGDFDTITERARESFEDPDNAPITTDAGVTWTTEWTTIRGILADGTLLVD